MDDVSVADIVSGTVVHDDGRDWLVVESRFGPPPFGFYPPWELVLMPATGGTARTLRCTTARRLCLVPAMTRVMNYVCVQEGELLLLEPETGIVHTLSVTRTRRVWGSLEPECVVEVVFHLGQPVWLR